VNLADKGISQAQLRALQTLFGLYARKSLDVSAKVRGERLAWASQTLGRAVASFSDLDGDEAARLVGILKQALGQETESDERKRRSREAAFAAGTHGRRNRPIKIEMMATAGDIEAVNEMRQRLGMSQEDFERWLTSRSSPIRGRTVPTLRTIADCNRVRWALKAMLKRAS
jgi:hypothetical protein